MNLWGNVLDPTVDKPWFLEENLAMNWFILTDAATTVKKYIIYYF